jgi:hypothetical protein
MQTRPYRVGWLATLAVLGTTPLAGAQGADPGPPVEATEIEATEEEPPTVAPVADESGTTEAPDSASTSDQPVSDLGTEPSSDGRSKESAPPTSVAGEARSAAGFGAEEGTEQGGPEAAESDRERDDDKKDKKPKKQPWEKKPKTKVRGLLRALWLLHDDDEVPVHEFRLASARVELDWKHAKLLEATVELDAAQDSGAPAWSALRDAYVRVKPLRELRIRAGQFKKPFSRLELRGRRKLRLIDRGITNAWIVEDLGYGERDIGVQLEGRVGDETSLSYRAGVFNGSGPNAREADLDGSKDFAARLELDHGGWLSLGMSGSHQRFDPEMTPLLPRSGTMGEADFRLSLGRLRVLGEAMYGENQLSIDHAESWSALLLASYKIPLTRSWEMALEPVAKAEVLKIEHHVRDAHIWAATIGANYHLGRRFRLMAQGEWIRPSANTLDLWAESHRLLVQAIVDLR